MDKDALIAPQGKPLADKNRQVPRKRGRPKTCENSTVDIRGQLLSAAQQAYGEHGYNGVTVELILQASGVSRPTFYRYFKSRYAIIDEVIKQANDALATAVFTAVSAHSAALDRAKAAIAAYFQWCADIGPVAAAIYGEIYDSQSPAGKHRERIIAAFVSLLHAQAASLGRAKLDPLFYDTLIRSVEHLGSGVFTADFSTAEVQRRQRIAEHVLLTALAEPADRDAVPSLAALALE